MDKIDQQWEYNPNDNAIMLRNNPDCEVIKFERFEPQIGRHIVDCHNALLILPKLLGALKNIPEDALEEIAEIGNVLTVSDDRANFSEALHEVCRLGANPFTEQKCKTRTDFVRLVTKIYTVAADAIRQAEETEQEGENHVETN